MGVRSERERYGAVAVALHWVSAVLVLLLIPIGYFMAGFEGGMKTLAYRSHLVFGGLLLLLTLARIVWRWIDVKPEPPPGIEGIHAFAFEAVHVLLYIGLLGSAASGVALSIQSGVGESLFFGDGSIPADFWEYPPRMAHRVFSWSITLLTLGHVGGVALHQATKSDVMARIGLRGFSAGSGVSSDER